MPTWTKEQLDAINKTGKNIIVSAGAGSGKTAVLTERVITKIKNNIHINELLILTFTNNAAMEMKTRIKKAILKIESIKEEAKLVESSYITTFDAFVLSLVKRYHYLLNISNKIKIIDSSIINKIKKDYLNEIFEEYYKQENQKFINLVTSLGIKNDKSFKKIILNLEKNIDLITNKEEFLNTYINNYYTQTNINNLFNIYENNLFTAINSIKIALENLSYEASATFMEKYITVLNPLLKSKSYKEIKNSLDIPTIRLTNSTEKGKYYKNEISKIIKELKTKTIYSEELLKEEVYKTKEHAEIIINIISQLDLKLKEFKNKYDMYEFNDISKFAIKLLKENDNIRIKLKNSFKEIMIDEYQDTSDVQEEFISLISNNNVYMVGDIKQSIYRFRNANPDIFKIKYDDYKNNINGIKIDLNKNFRSREEVLTSINNIFDHIMDNSIGNAEYKKEHQLVFGNLSFTGDGDNKNNNYLEIYNYEPNNINSKEEIEAFIIGNDIKNKIKNKYLVLDDTLRPCTYKDFCILMDRTTSFNTYKKIFDYLKIPLNIYKDNNILENIETHLIKNIISFILNVKDNIFNQETSFYFTSIARSYLFNISDNEIYDIIKNKKIKETNIYKISKNIANNIDTLSNKEFIYLIIDDFKFYEKIISTSDINNKTIILNNLIEKISALNEIGINIYEINEYLSSLINDKEELKISAIINNNDSVCITNIHKSKGLEYKICYYSGLYKEFNFDELKSKITFNNYFGLIIPLMEKSIKPTFITSINKEKFIKDEISEKIRLFYVALTRAKEKMIIISDLNPEKYINNDQNNVLDYLTRIKYKSFKDIMSSIYPFIEKYTLNVKVPTITNEYIITKEVNIENIPKINSNISVKLEEIKNNLINQKHYSKTTNNLLTIEEKENMEYGIKLHYLLENIDFKKPNLSICNDFEKDIITSLLNNKIFDNIKNANIFKEYEFIYENNNEEKHGIIDLLMEYDDYNIIVDYKLKYTDDENYLKQLDGYKKYIENKTNKKTYIYLYSLLNKKLIDFN